MKKLAAAIFFDSFIMILLGLILVMSASSTYSGLKFDSVYHLFSSHFFKVLIGIVFMGLFAFIPYEVYRDISKPAMITVTIVLVLTLFIAPDIKGGRRWIDLGFFSFQPADAAKLILIIHISSLVEAKKHLISSFKHGFLYLFIWIAGTAGLILVQPNVSNALIVVLVSFTILYVGGARLSHIMVSSAASLVSGGLIAMLFHHSRTRILTFFNYMQNGGDINLQVKQALLSLGSGGIFGVGIGNSRQSDLFLPEAYGDFIFAVMGEELGFIGSMAVLLGYLILFLSGVLIAKKTKDRFGQLLAFGITLSIIISAFINVAVATGLVPTTGLPLPFISYGGTSLIFLCIAVGILINIALSNSAESRLQPQMIPDKGRNIFVDKV